MLAHHLKIPLGDFQAACRFIVTRLADHVRRGGDADLGYLMYWNQLQGALLFTAGTEGEPIVKHAQDALDGEYRRLTGPDRAGRTDSFLRRG